MFWFRIAQFLYAQRNRLLTSLAKGVNRRLMKKYGVEIMLGAQIEEGLWVGHPMGIVINSKCIIGKNFEIRQNTTIGTTAIDSDSRLPIVIGDNVSVGANSCIVGNGLRIGSNVNIGAMSFVNKDVPSDCTYVTVKEFRIAPKTAAHETG